MNEYVKNLNRLEFVVTMACTGSCRHCSEGDHGSRTEHIDGDAAVNAIREVCREYKIESLMTFGGEPLLYPQVVCKIHKGAAEAGIPRRELITNGFFTKDRKRIRETAGVLAESGVSRVMLSVDAFHQETIPLEPVRYFGECVRETGIHISLNPAWLVRESDNNPYNVRTREIIREFEVLGIPTGSGNIIFPSGNAVRYLGEYFEGQGEFSNPYEENPEDIRAVSFSPGGDVLNGNIYRKSILDILDEYGP